MEMQQSELFIQQPPSCPRVRHLRIVQSAEKIHAFRDVASVSLSRKRPSGQDFDSGTTAARARTPRGGLKALAPEHLEGFLNLLHGEALLVGALSYDLGLRLSQLRFLRIRDVNLVARVIELSDGARRIPEPLFDDLKEHISEKMCGRECKQGGSKRDQLLFSHQAFEGVLSACVTFLAKLPAEISDQGAASELRISSLCAGRRADVGHRVRDNLLRIVGWFLTKRVAQRGGRVQSPLGLFEKGPKIVRRTPGGVVHSYYLWRAVCS